MDKNQLVANLRIAIDTLNAIQSAESRNDPLDECASWTKFSNGLWVRLTQAADLVDDCIFDLEDDGEPNDEVK